MMSNLLVTFLALSSRLIAAISTPTFHIAIEGTKMNCWPATSILRPIIYKECLDTINTDLISPSTDPNIPLMFSKDNQLNPDFPLPKFWKSASGNCIVGIDYEHKSDGYDRTSLHDIKRAALAIARTCVIRPPHLGGVIEPVGWQNKLGVSLGGFELSKGKILNNTLSLNE
ncbi:MAG: hypothetical protein Q9209_006066 [Squamulea sp. 1 TL-2023]